MITTDINTAAPAAAPVLVAPPVDRNSRRSRSTPRIHNSIFEAQRAARLLTNVVGSAVAVTPLIVVVDPESLVRKKPDVTVRP